MPDPVTADGRPTVLTFADACADVVARRLAGRGPVRFAELDASLPTWPTARVHRAIRTLDAADRVEIRYFRGRPLTIELLDREDA